MGEDDDDLPAQLGVELIDHVPEPITDSTLGIAVSVPPRDRRATHRLVTLGDSLTAGFQHGAIFNGDWSWPVMVASALGVDLVRPDWSSPLGGTPLNLERLVTQFADHGAAANLETTYAFARRIADYYGEGPGAQSPDPAGPVNENLAVWGWDLRDVLSRTADTEAPTEPYHRHALVPQLPQSPWAGVRTLNSARREGAAQTMLGAARLLGEDGGIETLCVCLGANNILSTVIDLEVKVSQDGYRNLEAKKSMNAWRVEHFRAELEQVVQRVARVDAEHVLWATVPHVTIPPVTHGLGGRLPECPRYFRYYARPWQDPTTFRPEVDRHLTGGQAWAIDMTIDAYNQAIVGAVREARGRDLDWRVVDLCSLLDRLAVRRNKENGAEPTWVADLPSPLPPEYTGLTTRFFGADEAGRRTQGGLFGLDGVHPTTAAYGLVAQHFLDVIVATGVNVPRPAVDFADVLAHDSLNSAPPLWLDRTMRWLRRVDHLADPVQKLLGQHHRLPF